MDTTDIRKGLKMMIDGQPYSVIEFQFVKPGKGQAFTRLKAKNLMTGTVLERTYKSGEGLDPADVEERQMEYIYPDGKDFVFMDSNTGEQLMVPGDSVGTDSQWLTDGLIVGITVFNGRAIGITLPTYVTLQIVEASGIGKQTKPVTLSTGAVIEAPIFIQEGDWVRVETSTSAYIERVNRK